MKKLLLLLAVAFIFAACTNTKKDDSANAIKVQDTLGLSDYQRWKMENEVSQTQSAQKVAASLPVNNAKSSARPKSSSSRGGTYHSSGNAGSAANTGNSGTASTPAPQPQQQKKGMSHTAKGAIVGAASGAVIGAIANKNDRLGGGVVGGVIGAATGAGVGAIVDKKERKRND